MPRLSWNLQLQFVQASKRVASNWDPLQEGKSTNTSLLNTLFVSFEILLQLSVFQISSLGYKSVAHYLIQTRRATDKLPTSAKRSLPFSDIDEITVREHDLSKPTSESLNPDPLSTKESDGNKLAPESETEPMLNPIAPLSKDQVEHPLKPEAEELGAGCCVEQKIVKESKTNMELLNGPSINEPKEGSLSETLERGDDCEIKNCITVQKTPASTKKRVRYEPTPDNVAGRLRLRRNKVDAGETETSTNIAATLERGGDDYEIKNHITMQKTPKSTKKLVQYEPTPDSVAGRLRLRRNKANAGETETSPSIAVN